MGKVGAMELTEAEIAALVADPVPLDGESTGQIAERMFAEHAVAAAASICQIAMYGQSERIRLDAAKYVTERVLGRVQDNPPKIDNDPYEKLMAECVKFVDAAETGVAKHMNLGDRTVSGQEEQDAA